MKSEILFSLKVATLFLNGYILQLVLYWAYGNQHVIVKHFGLINKDASVYTGYKITLLFFLLNFGRCIGTYFSSWASEKIGVMRVPYIAHSIIAFLYLLTNWVGNSFEAYCLILAATAVLMNNGAFLISSIQIWCPDQVLKKKIL